MVRKYIVQCVKAGGYTKLRKDTDAENAGLGFLFCHIHGYPILSYLYLSFG